MPARGSRDADAGFAIDGNSVAAYGVVVSAAVNRHTVTHVAKRVLCVGARYPTYDVVSDNISRCVGARQHNAIAGVARNDVATHDVVSRGNVDAVPVRYWRVVKVANPDSVVDDLVTDRP